MWTADDRSLNGVPVDNRIDRSGTPATNSGATGASGEIADAQGARDPRQAVAASLFWSDDHPPPSEDEDAVAVTHPKFRLDLKDGALTIETKGPLSIECQTFSLKGLDGSEIAMVDGKLTLKADIIETDGETRLDKGNKQVHRVQDHDSRGDLATEGSPRVYA